MFTAIKDMKYLKLELVWNESVYFIKNTSKDIARYLLCHPSELIIVYSLDNNILFHWDQSQVVVRESLLVFYDDMKDYLDELRTSLLSEQSIYPKLYSNICPFQDDYICLYPQFSMGNEYYDLLHAKIETSDSFDKAIGNLQNIDKIRFENEILFLLFSHYIGQKLPVSEQRLDYGPYKIYARLMNTKSGTVCHLSC